MLSGQVKAVEAWANFGTELDKVLNEFGLAKPNDLNDLLAAASFLAPGAVSAAGAGTAGMGGYHAAAGYDLDLTTATPDVDLLTDALATLINGKTYFNTPAPLSADGAGAYKSADDQSLLFQIYLKSDMVIDLDQGETATAYAGTASAQNAWSKAFAQKVLNADISADEVTSFDHQSQAKLIEAIVEKDAALSVKLDGIQTSASKSVLANPYGAEFVSADGTSAVEVARSVAIAETAAAADDQTAMVRMRQSGTKDLSVMFYKVDDLSGTVGGFKPGEAGYDAASTAHAYKTDTGMTWVSGGGYGKYSEANLTDVDAGDLIAMKLSNGETTFYAFANANEVVNDAHVAHLWSYGLNTWGWEDLYGGGDTDFNDLVVKLDFLPTAHDQVL